ncbi:MAG: AAA family ATPase [Hoeflea sp.]|nr:MAG: AAA family ATPase [Hoeflea sp.]
MLDHPTLDRLKALRLDGMAEALAELQAQDAVADLSHVEWLGLLVDREVASRETKRFEARMRSARLRHVGACPEDVDYRVRRGLDKALFQSLLTGKWITDKRNLIITGPCGVGKTWLGCALAQAACRDGVTVVYKRMPRLFEELELAHGDGRFPRLFRSITKAQLLILDDWGPDRLTATQRRDLMEVVEERYGRAATMITSQLPIKAWHDVIGEPTFADAILDRIVHNAYRLELEGQSLRKTVAKMDDETPQARYLKNAASRQHVTGGRMLRNKWAHVVGMSGRMLRNTQTRDTRTRYYQIRPGHKHPAGSFCRDIF